MALSLQKHSWVCTCRIRAAVARQPWPRGPSFSFPSWPDQRPLWEQFCPHSLKSCGGRSRGGKTNVKMFGWSWVVTGQLGDENGWQSLSPLGSAACLAAGQGGQNICQLGSSYSEWTAFVLGAGKSMCSESHINQEAQVMARSPVPSKQKRPPTMERGMGRSIRRKGSLPLYGAFCGRGLRKPENTLVGSKNLPSAGRLGVPATSLPSLPLPCEQALIFCQLGPCFLIWRKTVILFHRVTSLPRPFSHVPQGCQLFLSNS